MNPILGKVLITAAVYVGTELLKVFGNKAFSSENKDTHGVAVNNTEFDQDLDEVYDCACCGDADFEQDSAPSGSRTFMSLLNSIAMLHSKEENDKSLKLVHEDNT